MYEVEKNQKDNWKLQYRTVDKQIYCDSVNGKIQLALWLVNLFWAKNIDCLALNFFSVVFTKNISLLVLLT